MRHTYVCSSVCNASSFHMNIDAVLVDVVADVAFFCFFFFVRLFCSVREEKKIKYF